MEDDDAERRKTHMMASREGRWSRLTAYALERVIHSCELSSVSFSSSSLFRICFFLDFSSCNGASIESSSNRPHDQRISISET